MDNSQIAPSVEQGNKQLGNSYLSFYLNQQTPALLLMEYAQEIIVVPLHRITPMPNMPGCVLGLLNRRSRVLWVVNLAQLLELPIAVPMAQQYQIIIICVGQIKLGLVAQSVKCVTHFPQHSSQTPINLSSSLAPYVSGCMPQGNETLIVLNAEKIATSPNLQHY